MLYDLELKAHQHDHGRDPEGLLQTQQAHRLRLEVRRVHHRGQKECRWEVHHENHLSGLFREELLGRDLLEWFR